MASCSSRTTASSSSRCVTRIVELDLAQHAVAVHDGGYEAYLEEREIARRHAREAYEEFAGTKADLESRARTQREWSSKGVRNAVRKSPDNDKIRRAASIDSAEKQARKVRQMESRIARLEEVEEPRKEWVLQFSIGDAPRSSSVVATLNEARVRRGDFTLGPVSLQVDARDRIGITGPNGAGKTTLLGLLLGRLAPGSGQRQPRSERRRRRDRPGPHRAARRPAARRRLRRGGARPRSRRAPDAAGQVRPARRPGDRVRCHGSRRVSGPGPPWRCCRGAGVNLLVLDEPTNHLDLPAIEQLEEALASYDGALLLVSHDRRLLENVHLDQRWHVEHGRVTRL